MPSSDDEPEPTTSTRFTIGPYTKGKTEVPAGVTPHHMQLLVDQLIALQNVRKHMAHDKITAFPKHLKRCKVVVNGQQLTVNQMCSALKVYLIEALRPVNLNIHNSIQLVQSFLQDTPTMIRLHPDFPAEARKQLFMSSYMSYMMKHRDHSVKFNFAEGAKEWSNLPEEAKLKWEKKHAKYQAKARDQINQFCDENPELEKVRDKLLRTPREQIRAKEKAAKPVPKLVTAFECYCDAKRQKYMDKGVEGEDLEEKLQRHFGKLKSQDLAEYESQAKRLNKQPAKRKTPAKNGPAAKKLRGESARLDTISI